MPRLNVVLVGVAALACPLGCSGGDLTLPGSAEPAAILVVSGDGQSARPGTLLDQPLTVQILDASSRPVQQATVEFSFVGDVPGASLDPASVLTDAEGHAAAVVRLGDVTGEQLIVAKVASISPADLRARFSVTALPGGGHGRDGGGD